MSIPGAANPLLLATAAAGGYNVERSLRFNSSDSAYCSRTPASAGNRKTWTWAGWVKRSAIADSQRFFGTLNSGGTLGGHLQFTAAGELRYVDYTSGGTYSVVSSSLYRDPSAWYHIVCAFDTTQATAASRIRLYVNSVLLTSFSTANYHPQNTDGEINTATAHSIGRAGDYAADYFTGYFADIHFIDGQALDPSSFVETSATTGQLIPKAYTGTFTGNSFWLKFADNSAATATTLGKDSSGLGNNWTPNNLSVTAGAGNDSLTDTPTSYGTDTGAGGEVRGNYATLNPINKNSGLNLLNGNLDATWSSGSALGASATIALPTSGKWYCEITNTGSSGIGYGIGISDSGRQTFTNSGILWADGAGSYYRSNGDIGCDGKATQTGSTYTTGDIISIAYDATTRKIWFAKNGTWQLSGNPASGTNEIGTLNSPTGNYFFGFAIYDTNTGTVNFGQRSWAYAAPAGFKALCDTNLPAPVVAKPSTVFDTLLYTGNGASRSITGLGFNPDLVWIKERNAAADHALYDAVRGAQIRLESNTTDAEVATDGGVTAFNGDGFSLGTLAQVNTNADTYVAWAWDAGSSTVTNTQGSITSQVRTNGYLSIVTYTGNSTVGATVGHGLGVAPQLIIIKGRNNVSGGYWQVYHQALGNTKYLELNSTTAANTSSNRWNNTTPSSTVFTLGSDSDLNGSLNYVAYCFAPVASYSAFGSFTGNGSADGPFVYTGIRPKYILLKRTDAAEDWAIRDTSRSPYNASTTDLAANQTYGDFDSTGNSFDILSNGFKPRNTRAMYNASGATYIYAAFAESPFAYARAR